MLYCVINDINFEKKSILKDIVKRFEIIQLTFFF